MGSRGSDDSVAIQLVADAISSLLQRLPGEQAFTERIEFELSPTGRAWMEPALDVLETEGVIKRDGILVRHLDAN